jgi:hypothetical protein
MSKHMLSDSNSINNFNPFVMGVFSLPGASRKPHEFEKFPISVQEETFPDDNDTSPMCDYGITAGDNTIDMCRPPGVGLCSLSRPLLPERNIDRGLVDKANYKKSKVKKSKVTKVTGFPTEAAMAALIVFLILLIALR